MKSKITMFLLTLTFTTFANEQPTSTNEQPWNTVANEKECYITYDGEDRIRTQECHRYLYEHDDEFRVNVVNNGPDYVPRGGIERYTMSVANRENPERIIVHREPTFDAYGRDRNILYLTEENRNDINQYFDQIAADSEVPPAFSWESIDESCHCEGDMTNNDNLYACFVKNKDKTCAKDIWVKIDLEYRVAKEKKFLGNDFDKWLTFANRFCKEEKEFFIDKKECVEYFINQYNINDQRLLTSLSDLAEGECRGNSNTIQNVESFVSQGQQIIQSTF